MPCPKSPAYFMVLPFHTVLGVFSSKAKTAILQLRGLNHFKFSILSIEIVGRCCYTCDRQFAVADTDQHLSDIWPSCCWTADLIAYNRDNLQIIDGLRTQSFHYRYGCMIELPDPVITM